MATNLWINLPAKDLARSRDFYTKAGFIINDKHARSDMLSLVVGKPGVIVNLFEEAAFAGMAGGMVADTASGSEVMLSIGADSRADVDTLTAKAASAGAHVFGKPVDVQGWMYGSGFSDPDGHRWNLLYMDLAKMPGG